MTLDTTTNPLHNMFHPCSPTCFRVVRREIGLSRFQILGASVGGDLFEVTR
jgi:hypothetical protein